MIVVIVVGLLLSFPGLLNKFMTAYQELVDYKWDEMNPDQSVTMRISFYRMAFFYFIQNPIQGWGDLGWQSLMNHPDLTKFASSYTRESTAQGFHNEIITNTIRSGIWGLIASMLFYGVPIKRAIRGLVQVDQKLKIVSFNLLIFILHLFFAGLTTEVTNLVFLCSFIGISLSVMMAEQGKIESIKNKNQFLLK
jgi:O-antigen ligase